MNNGNTTKEISEQLTYQLHIMKAIGWYLDIRKDIKQNEIAQRMNLDPAVISRSVISPKKADNYTEKDLQKSKEKRPIDISRAEEMCKQMHTTLNNILYYYQFKNSITKSSEIAILENLTNELTNSAESTDLLSKTLDDIKCTVNQMSISSSPIHNSSNSMNLLITDVNHQDFKPWFGKYYCYFSSTSSDEAGKRRKAYQINRFSEDTTLRELLEHTTNDYIFCGIWNVYDGAKTNDGLCHVDFKFLANPKKNLIKRYKGLLTLSANTKAVFCELASQEQGEKSYFILDKQDLGKDQPFVQCCMAMVLTYSSKVNRRRPCCERMIVSRTPIKEGTEEYEIMKSYLLMNDKTIRITQWGYSQLIEDIRKSNDDELYEIAKYFPDLKSLSGKTISIEDCAFIPESVIYTLRLLSDSQKRKFETLLRIHSIAPWYCKTKATKIDALFALLNEVHD